MNNLVTLNIVISVYSQISRDSVVLSSFVFSHFLHTNQIDTKKWGEKKGKGRRNEEEWGGGDSWDVNRLIDSCETNQL